MEVITSRKINSHYTTSTKISDLVNFYSDKMKQTGWENLGAPAITRDEARIALFNSCANEESAIKTPFA